jgi:V8-like Glu-specific endopeptidase
VSESEVSKAADAAVEYWTEERQRNARPVDPPSEELARDTPDRGEVDPSATPTATEASEGPAGSAAVWPQAPEVFATQLVAQPGQFPHRTVGRLFFRTSGQDTCASAAVVNQRGILTAAHCIRNPYTGQWSTDVAFAPAYDNGVNPPFGLWAIGRMWVRNEWLGPPVDVSFDFGFCTVQSRNGMEIGDLVGWLGVVGDRPDLRYWDNHGYPEAPIPGYNFNGLRMWNCGGDFSQAVGLTIRKDGNFTGGSSGGPWIVRHAGSFAANGTQSMRFNDPPTENSSPYFRDVVAQLYRDAFG